MKTSALFTGLSDAQLAEHVHQVNHEAFKVLVLRYSPLVKSILYNVLRNMELAEDGLQNVWMKVFLELRAGHYRENGQFKGWIYRMAHNAALDIIKAENHHLHEELNETNEPYAELPEGRDDDGELAYRGFRRLKPDMQRVVLLHWKMKMTFEKVGQKMKLHADTVRQMFHRALKMIKRYVLRMKEKIYFMKSVTKTGSAQLLQ